MSSPIEPFLCHGRPSRRLLALHLSLLGLLALAGMASALPLAVLNIVLLLALLQACQVLARYCMPQAFMAHQGLRHDAQGWWLQQGQGPWQPIMLRPASLVLPGLVVLRYRQPGQWFDRALCLPADSLPAETHRRLRVRLRFARQAREAPAESQTGQ